MRFSKDSHFVYIDILLIKSCVLFTENTCQNENQVIIMWTSVYVGVFMIADHESAVRFTKFKKKNEDSGVFRVTDYESVVRCSKSQMTNPM